jgi:zinc protease
MFLPLLAALALVPGTASAADWPKAEYKLKLDDYSISTVDFRFPSGLRILLQEDHTQPIVSVTNWFDRGSTVDGVNSKGESVEGIAHAVEHLAFRAKHGNLPKNWDVISQLGGVLNASTSTDWTNYMTVAPVDATVPLLRIEAMRMDNGVRGVTAEDVEAEKAIVRNELRMGYESGSNGSPAVRTAFVHIPKLLFPEGHPYRNTTIGSHDTIVNIDLDSVQRYVRENYRPEYSTIAMVGDFNLADGGAMRMIFEAFDQVEHLLMTAEDAAAYKKLTTDKDRYDFLEAWIPKLEAHLKKTMDEPAPPRVNCDARPEPPPLFDKTTMKVKGMVDKSTAVAAWSLPGGYCSDDFDMNLAANQMADYIIQTIDSTIYSDSDRTRAAYEGVGCFADANKHASFVVCFVEEGATGKLKADALLDKVADSLYLAWNPVTPEVKPFYDRAFSRARLQLMTQTLESTDNIASLYGRSFFVSSHAHYSGRATYFSDNINAYAKISAEPAKALSQKYITRDRMARLVIEPIDEEERERLEASAGEADKENTVAEHRAEDDRRRQLFDPELLTPEAIAAVTVVPDLERIKVATLENGLEVIAMNHGSSPMVKIGLFVDGNNSSAPIYGLDSFSEALYYTGRKSSDDPLAVAGSVFRGDTEIYATGSSGNVDALLHKMRWLTEDYDWVMANKAEYIRKGRSGAKGGGKTPEGWAGRLARERLFPDHPYGKWMRPNDYDVMEAWAASDVQKWVHTKWQPANARLIIVGKVDADEAVRLAREYFGSWKPDPVATVGEQKPPPPPTAQPERQVLLFDKPIATQSKVRVSCQLKKDGAEDVPRTQVIGEVFTFFAFERLREQAGLTYGAYASPQMYWGDTTELYMGSVIQNSGVGFGIETFFKIIAEGANGDISDGIIATNKWNVARTSVTGLQSGDQMLYALSAPGRGKLESYYKGYPKHLGAVTKAEIQEALSTCAGHEVVTIVGPVAAVEPQLKERGIPYQVVNWEELYLAQLTPKEQKKYLKSKAKEEAEAAAKKKTEGGEG